MVLMWAVVFFALLSAVSYFRKFWRKVDGRIKKRRRNELLALERRRQRKAMRQKGSMGGGDAGLGSGATILKPPGVKLNRPDLSLRPHRSDRFPVQLNIDQARIAHPHHHFCIGVYSPRLVGIQRS